MHDPSPFQQFIPPRVNRLAARLKRGIWRSIPDSHLSVERSSPTRDHTPWEQVGALNFQPVTQTPIHWGNKFDHCWWRVQIPANTTPNRRYLHWRDQGEATAWLDGQPIGGIDPAHVYLPLPDHALHLHIESIAARTGIFVPGSGSMDAQGSRFEGASLVHRDVVAWKLQVDIELLLDLVRLLHRQRYPLTSDVPASMGFREPIEQASPLLRTLLHELDSVVASAQSDGLDAAARRMEIAFEKLRGADESFRVILTGHAHIDLVWLWPENAGEFKAVHSFSNVLALQQEYPELIFGYSQPASYEAVERRSPRLMQRVRQAIADGRWEATGATYVESDTQLACGEALARAFELGQAGFAAIRPDARPSSVLWIPDVFGYSGVIPTLMKAYGVKGFFTTKLTWSGATRFPHTSFIWRGNDGSEVVAHLSPQGYNGDAQPSEIDRAANWHRQSHIHPEGLHCIGYGDGGGGPTREMVHRVRRLADLRGLHPAQWGSIEDFFDRLSDRRDELPVWQGEMYLEFHRGVQTTHSNLKAAFRRLERHLQILEAAHCATDAGPIDEHLWKRMVFAQFHDYIPGSSIRRVIEETVPELQSLGDSAHQSTTDALSAPGERCLFNPLPFARTHLHEGQHLALPALSGVTLADAPRTPAPSVEVSGSVMDNGRIRVKFDAMGRVTRLADARGELALAGPIGQLAIAPDYPVIFDAWDIDRSAMNLAQPISAAPRMTINTDDPCAPRVRFDFDLGTDRIATTYCLPAGSSVVLVEHEVDWRTPERLLMCLYPTAYRSGSARFGAPFASCLRPQQPGTLVADAMFEVPASRWATVCDDAQSQGLLVISQAKYGFGCMDGLMHLSLLRSAVITGQNPSIPRDMATAAEHFSDIGSHVIRSAIGLYRADAQRDAQPAALADALFTGPVEYVGKPVNAGLRDVIGSPSVVPAWARPLGAGRWLLRLHETLGAHARVQLDLAPGWRAMASDMQGNASGALSNNALDIGPYAIATVLIERQ